MQLAALCDVVADRTVALDHALIAELALAGVVVEPIAPAVVEVPVHLAARWVAEDEHVFADLRRADPALPTAAVALVEFGATEGCSEVEVESQGSSFCRFRISSDLNTVAKDADGRGRSLMAPSASRPRVCQAHDQAG